MIGPYVLRPVPPDVALLTEGGEVVDEHGQLHSLDALPKGLRVWCSYDTVRALILAGRGEALCWWGEEIRWRHRRFEEGWTRRPSDVTVIHAPFPETADGSEDVERALRGLAAWRDWLGDEGASPLSSLGSASWSLLRATLEEDLWWAVGETPPIRQVLGGRQELSVRAPGQFQRAFHYDLSAAYATTLGALQYGGWWNELPAGFDPARFSGDGRCLFVRARVRIPELPFGPLVRRPRKVFEGRMRFFLQQMLGNDYPTGCRLQGVWTWEEVRAALEGGCTLEKVLGGWVHTAGGRRPFAPWWQAVERGRALEDRLAAMLAKMTGNSLWGQFCIGSSREGAGRTIAWRERGKRRERRITRQGSRMPAVDLAETVTGRVRARLFELLTAADGSLVSAHTDGGWSSSELELGEGWRQDKTARKIQVLTPQALRWYPVTGRQPQVVLAGVPARSAPAVFDRLWRKHKEGNSGREDADRAVPAGDGPRGDQAPARAGTEDLLELRGSVR